MSPVGPRGQGAKGPWEHLSEPGRVRLECVRRVRREESGTRGEQSGTRGDQSGMRGDQSGTRGDQSGMRGDQSGTRGEQSGTRGEHLKARWASGGEWWQGKHPPLDKAAPANDASPNPNPNPSPSPLLVNWSGPKKRCASARLATPDSRQPLRTGAATVLATAAAVWAIDGAGCRTGWGSGAVRSLCSHSQR